MILLLLAACDDTLFGVLPDTEENRLAAKAADQQGWPYCEMTGAEVDRPGAAGFSLRQMAAMPYDPVKHSLPARLLRLEQSVSEVVQEMALLRRCLETLYPPSPPL